MAQAMVNFRMDAELKQRMEETCRKMGLTLTAAFTMFAAKVTQDRRIPFEVTAEHGASPCGDCGRQSRAQSDEA